MVKKGMSIIAITIISLFILSGCDVYNTLYVKQPALESADVIDEEDIIVLEEVYRIDGTQSMDQDVLDKEVYASANPVEHDPFELGENPMGPFEKGEPLGFTMQEWLDAKGDGLYVVENGVAEIELSFEKLVPEGVYTVWCSRMVMPPEFEVIDIPCGFGDGSDNIMIADEDGNAEYSVIMDPLEPSTRTESAVIAIAYHSDGETYGEEPGDFGKVTHFQLFTMLPVINEEEFELDLDLVNHIQAGLPEQDVFVELEASLEEEIAEIVEEEEVPVSMLDEEEVSDDAVVVIVEETERISLRPEAEDPDRDVLTFTYTNPLDQDGEWETTYGDAGEYTVTVTASDGTLTASKQALIIIKRKEEAPTIEIASPSDTELSVEETEDIVFSVEATDLNDDELTYVWELDGQQVGDDDVYSYETTYDDTGNHVVRIMVSDGMFEEEHAWEILVENLNRRPILEAIDDVVGRETDTIVLELEAIDEDGNQLEYTINDGRFTREDNVFTWETSYEDAGEHLITVAVSDGEDRVTQDIVITIENVNRPPVILDIVQQG